ncbi:hypothetical protein NDK47_07480 [Brevibacillus ruminantium]|uniref:Uncharacterized protein n=1 Tax=Brevibacillus ruminantium TaxID=2950604 RepID=A0ABY4WKB6_9BACL|nr:hypothetical protein [Brevibacillus ruminantium]USG67124.1 hypothetical protein NDK47_07480 [Brevibacillus ruminantium]
MWKKGSAVLLALTLVLTGCSGQAALVRDSVVASLEKPNYDYQGSLKLVGDVDKLPEALGEKADAEGIAVLNALKAGVSVKGSQLDLNNTKLQLEVNDDKLLRDNGLWTGDKKAGIELIVGGNDLYVKSPLDKKYLKLDANNPGNMMMGAPEESALDPAKLKSYQEKINKLTMDFTKKYIAKYGYKLSNVKNAGTETVELPNGEKVKATHITINLDTKELIQMFFYTANDAVANQDVKAFAIDLLVLTKQLEEDLTPDAKKTTDAEKKAYAETTVTASLTAAKAWLDKEGKTYTPEKIIEMGKEQGFHGVNWTLDYYIDEAKMPIRQKSTLNVSFVTDPTKKDQKPITLGLEGDTLSYNFGKATKYEVPAKDAFVTVEQLKKDEKAKEAFDQKGFFRSFVETLTFEPDWDEEWDAVEDAATAVGQ